MRVTIKDPDYFRLIHKKSGLKFNTYNCDYIGYDDEKFDVEYPKKQAKLI